MPVALACAAILAALASGCGNPGPDVFGVKRTGQGAGAALTVIVHDNGFVSCNGSEHRLPDAMLVQARNIQPDLEQAATDHVRLPAGAGSVLGYTVATPSGNFSFYDNSAGKRAVFNQLQLLILRIATQVCGLSR